MVTDVENIYRIMKPIKSRFGERLRKGDLVSGERVVRAALTSAHVPMDDKGNTLRYIYPSDTNKVLKELLDNGSIAVDESRSRSNKEHIAKIDAKEPWFYAYQEPTDTPPIQVKLLGPWTTNKALGEAEALHSGAHKDKRATGLFRAKSDADAVAYATKIFEKPLEDPRSFEFDFRIPDPDPHKFRQHILSSLILVLGINAIALAFVTSDRWTIGFGLTIGSAIASAILLLLGIMKKNEFYLVGSILLTLVSGLLVIVSRFAITLAEVFRHPPA